MAAICLPLLAVYLTVLAVEFYDGKQRAETQVKTLLQERVRHHAAELEGELAAVAQVAHCTARISADFSAARCGRGAIASGGGTPQQ